MLGASLYIGDGEFVAGLRLFGIVALLFSFLYFVFFYASHDI